MFSLFPLGLLTLVDVASSGSGVSAAFSLTAWTYAVFLSCEDEFKEQVIEVFCCLLGCTLWLEIVLPKVEYIEHILPLCSDLLGSISKNLLLLQVDICSDVLFCEMNRHRSVILQLHHRDAYQLICWILTLEFGFQVLKRYLWLWSTWKSQYQSRSSHGWYSKQWIYNAVVQIGCVLIRTWYLNFPIGVILHKG